MSKPFGWDELAEWLDPKRIEDEFRRRMPEALARVGETFVAHATTDIARDKPFEKNSKLTLLMKAPKSTPLIRDGDLIGSLTYDVSGIDSVRLGVQSRKLGSGGRWLAEVLHNGATIKITDKMRRGFMGALSKKLGKAKMKEFAASSTGQRKTHVVIPARPFIDRTLKSKRWQAEVQVILTDVVRGAIGSPPPVAR